MSDCERQEIIQAILNGLPDRSYFKMNNTWAYLEEMHGDNITSAYTNNQPLGEYEEVVLTSEEIQSIQQFCENKQSPIL